MRALLGMNDTALAAAQGNERILYSVVSWWLLVNVVISLLGNSFFGYLASENWTFTIALGLLMGFIHFSVLRLAMVTLVTKPLAAEPEPAELTAEELKKPLVKLKVILTRLKFINGSLLLRFLFVGAIAITVALSFSGLLHRNEAFSINEEHRLHVLQELKQKEFMSSHVLHEAHYPITVLEKLWETKITFRLQVFLVMISYFIPVLLLYWLREGKSFQYANRLREISKNEVLIDYNETVEQSQYLLDQSFPNNGYQLDLLSNYEDAPFNTQFKGVMKRRLGSKVEFISHLNSTL